MIYKRFGVVFEWDDLKSEMTRRDPARQFDFEFATGAWIDAEAVEFFAIFKGELRVQRIAKIDGKVHSIIYTMRGSNVRIISVRRARANEERRYGR